MACACIDLFIYLLFSTLFYCKSLVTILNKRKRFKLILLNYKK